MRLTSKLAVAFTLFSIVSSLLVLSVHFWPGNNSMLNMDAWPHLNPEKTLSENYLEEVLSYHQTEPAFKRRILTTKATLLISSATGLSWPKSFVIFNFFCLILSSILVCITAFTTSKSAVFSFLSGAVFWASFPILFAFFPTIYSYDDPLQYVFLLSTLLFVLKDKWVFAAMLYTLSLLARENSLLLLPGFLIIANNGWSLRGIRQSYKKVLPFILITLFYFSALFYWQYFIHDANLSSDISERFFGLAYNFADKSFALESIFSFLFVCGLAIVAWTNSKSSGPLKKAFWLTLFLNTLAVIIFAKARESRLFILPLIFWLPMAGKLLSQNVKTAIKTLKTYSWWSLPVILMFIGIAYVLAFKVYIPTGTRDFENWHHEYLFALLTFVLILSIKNNSKTPENG